VVEPLVAARQLVERERGNPTRREGQVVAAAFLAGADAERPERPDRRERARETTG